MLYQVILLYGVNFTYNSFSHWNISFLDKAHSSAAWNSQRSSTEYRVG